ncbi:MAG TPA: 16S rRNA (adenine(1518)-N(6)/adenine(1519)-N(6))-dimethyltransferase RsmA [Saprospiraceae bacterium]|nr:16S rRNA (adenine(1518)-N(6)/adenine(1519)-N(6))-dimethyltransferase RsmA [Saprospiraceae bacterium]
MRAKKQFGQHFLTQEPIAERLANALDTSGAQAVVEVGPGKGILTKYLLKQPLPVYAVELDRDMIPILKREFGATSLNIIQDDILRLRFDQLLGPETDFVIVGNFPYNISSQIVFLGLQHRLHMPFMAGMFQKEMAERIISPPGSKAFGVISALAQAYFRPELLFHVKPGSFSPPPKVNSSVISLTRYRSEIEGVPFQTLRQVVKIAFSQRRKKLRNTLRQIIAEDILKEENVIDLRPEQLAVEQFIMLARHVVNSQPT